jgi:ParB-like chromosome segregation protein Spo0J
MRVLNSTTKNEPIDAIKPHPQNPRQGDTGAIHQSIQTNGFYGTVIAQRSTGHILAGNHRWQAAQQAKAKTIPVTWIDVDDDHALRILLADNRTNDLATYNDAALTELLKSIQDDTGTLAGTGYDEKELDTLLQKLNQTETADDNSDQLISAYQIIVTCTNEQQQVNLLEQFAEQGYQCRALIS